MFSSLEERLGSVARGDLYSLFYPAQPALQCPASEAHTHSLPVKADPRGR